MHSGHQRHLSYSDEGRLTSDENDVTLEDFIPCELCGEEIKFDAAICPHCKAGRKPCPFCSVPFWHGTDICPHCFAHKPDPNSWSVP